MMSFIRWIKDWELVEWFKTSDFDSDIGIKYTYRKFESCTPNLNFMGVSFSGLGYLAYIQRIGGLNPSTPTSANGVMVAHLQGEEVSSYSTYGKAWCVSNNDGSSNLP